MCVLNGGSEQVSCPINWLLLTAVGQCALLRLTQLHGCGAISYADYDTTTQAGTLARDAKSNGETGHL